MTLVLWPKKRPKKANFAYFLRFFGLGTGPRGFSRPWHRISRQKCVIWMRIYRVMTIFVVFGKFGAVLRVLELFCLLWKLNFQAVIKSAASAASPIAWGEPGRRLRLAGDGFGWRATASGLSPSNRGGCASSRLDHGLKV